MDVVYAGIAVIILVLMMLCAVFTLWIRTFTRRLSFYVPILLALLLFGAGFVLRISGAQPMIDLGFFCTESAALFLTALFVAALVLGQQHYWELR
ncbi:TPA: hypothetical protein HA251_01375 [Candidatus Woesearchaeota archaeon]|nr:hypothetical protein [Candidatus Woesearchaeota archaeon]